MPKVAVLADIHGNLPALDAVLDDVAAADVDLIVLNGDLADGPFPSETLDRLAALGDRALWLRGNGDRWLVAARDGRFRHPDLATDAMMQWAAHRITDPQRNRLAHLPLIRSLDVPDLGRVGLCHATARSDNEMFLADSSVAHARAAFASVEAGTILVGHSHMPFDRMFDRRRIVNSGSVGMPYGHTGASWALLGPDVVLRRTAYDVERASLQILGSGMPGADEFVSTYVRTSPSEAEALDTFRAVIETQQRTGRLD